MRIPGPGKNLELAHVIGMQNVTFGEKTDPAGIAPKEDEITLGQETLFELWAQFFADIIHLFKRIEAHRHALQSCDSRLDLGETNSGQ